MNRTFVVAKCVLGKKLCQTGMLLATLSPSVVDAIEVDWQGAGVAATFTNTVDYNGSAQLPPDDPGFRTKGKQFSFNRSEPSLAFNLQQRVSAWGGTSQGRARIAYQALPNGSGYATIEYETSATSRYNPTTGEATGVTAWGGLATASIGLSFQTTENTKLEFAMAGRVTPADGTPYGLNSAGALVSYGGSQIGYTDDANMNFGVFAENGARLNGFQYDPLVAGKYGLVLSTLGTMANAYTAYSNSGEYIEAHSAKGWYSVMWSFEGRFPGSIPTEPIKFYPAAIDESDQSLQPVPVDGVFLTFPALGGLGHTGDAFVGLSTRVNSGASAGALVTGFEILSEYSPLTSVIVPNLPAGAEGLMIDIGAGPQSVMAGQTIDFGPEGRQSFTLAGFDPEFSSAELDAFVMGLRFAEEGLASLIAMPTLYIPRATSMQMA